VVRDYGEAISFFVGKLGFKVLEDTPVPEQGKRWVVVAPPGGGTSLVLGRASTPEQERAVGNQTGGRVFLFLHTDDVKRDHAALASKGITFVREPTKGPYGTAAVFKDLYGNLWDLVQLAAREVTVRPHRIGDMGLVTARQAILYAEEHGWNAEYEALCARVTADFIDGFDPKHDACWIAERDGTMLGSVFLVRHREREGVARLRLLYVEPAARGLGVGKRLVRGCTTFARAAGYRTITLWTQSILTAAHRIYQAEGYKLVHETTNYQFGKDLLSQTWELAL
jgi:GNAT superfamily N-acetyltransferase/catechol 2,3-dioxygenase-like lactoylglutathione lyase family enzyme